MMTTRQASPEAKEVARQIVQTAIESLSGESSTPSLIEGFDMNATGILLDLTEEIAQSRNESVFLVRTPQGWKTVFTPGSPENDPNLQTRVRETQAYQNVTMALRAAILERAGATAPHARYSSSGR